MSVGSGQKFIPIKHEEQEGGGGKAHFYCLIRIKKCHHAFKLKIMILRKRNKDVEVS